MRLRNAPCRLSRRWELACTTANKHGVVFFYNKPVSLVMYRGTSVEFHRGDGQSVEGPVEYDDGLQQTFDIEGVSPPLVTARATPPISDAATIKS
jgi:hypothetical protein